MFCSSSSIIPVAFGPVNPPSGGIDRTNYKLNKYVLDEYKTCVDSPFLYDERCLLSTCLITDDCFQFSFRYKTVSQRVELRFTLTQSLFVVASV